MVRPFSMGCDSKQAEHGTRWISDTFLFLSSLCNCILTSMKEAVPHFKSVCNTGQTPKRLYAHTPQCEITLGYSPVKVCSFSVFGATDLKPIPYGQYWLNNCGGRWLQSKAASTVIPSTGHSRIWDVGNSPCYYLSSSWSLHNNCDRKHQQMTSNLLCSAEKYHKGDPWYETCCDMMYCETFEPTLP